MTVGAPQQELIRRLNYLVKHHGWKSEPPSSSMHWDFEDLITMVDLNLGTAVMIELPNKVEYVFSMSRYGVVMTCKSELIPYVLEKMRRAMLLDDLAGV